MRLGPVLDHLFAGEPGKAQWVLVSLREKVDVASWADEWARARKRQEDRAARSADAQRVKAKLAARRRRAVAEMTR